MANYATAAELRTQIEKTGITGAASDAALGVILEGVSRAIDAYYNRPDGFVAISSATARYYAGQGMPYIFIDDCIEITLVAVKESPTDTTYTSWAATDWTAFSGDPQDPNFNSLPYTAIMTNPSGDYPLFISGAYSTRAGFRPSTGVTRGVKTVQVTAKWGYAASAPPLIKEVTLILSARLYKKGLSAHMDIVSADQFGQMAFRELSSTELKLMLDGSRYYKPAIGRR